MRVLPGAVLGSVALAVAALTAQTGQTPQISPATPVVPLNSPGRDAFAGTWEYNAEDSLNATTGRPETAAGRRTAAGNSGSNRTPRSGPMGPGDATGGRTGGAAGGGNPGGGGGSAGDPTPGYGGGAGWSVGGGGGYGPALMATELRDTERDLVEIPIRLTIALLADAVSFKDDLGRERSYPTAGKKRDYMLGAARYQARARWDGPQLIKDIEAPHGFKMSETYFLSADGQRMFVVIRLSPPRKDGKPNGFNRVYDRVQLVGRF